MSEFKAAKPRAVRLYQTLPHALLHRKVWIIYNIIYLLLVYIFVHIVCIVRIFVLFFVLPHRGLSCSENRLRWIEVHWVC